MGIWSAGILLILGAVSDSPLLVFPQVTQGGGLEVELFLSNPSPSSSEGRLEFRAENGAPTVFRVDGSNRSEVAFSLAPGAIRKIRLGGSGPLKLGYGLLFADGPSSLTAAVVYRFQGSEVSLPAVQPSGRYHAVVESAAGLQSALALLNAGPAELSLDLTLRDADGIALRQTTLTLPAGQRRAEFLSALFPGLSGFSSGSVHLASSQAFASISLRQRDDSGALAVLPFSPQALGPSSAPFGLVEIEPDFILDGEGSNIDSLAFWEAPDPTQSLLFVSAKGNELVEVWRYPFQDQELSPISKPFGQGRVNGLTVDQVGDLLYVAQAEPSSAVYVFSLPQLKQVRQFGGGPGGLDFGTEPNLTLLSDGQGLGLRLYLTADDIVYVFRPDGQLLDQFQPAAPRTFETIQGDPFYARLYIPDENDRKGVYAFDPQGGEVTNCLGSEGCRNHFGQGVFQDDGEGILLYPCPGDGTSDDGNGFIIVSDQRNSQTDFEVFDRVNWNHLGTLRLKGVGNTDGIASTQKPLPAYPLGLFAAVHDDRRTVGVGWHRILEATGLHCVVQ